MLQPVAWGGSVACLGPTEQHVCQVLHRQAGPGVSMSYAHLGPAWRLRAQGPWTCVVTSQQRGGGQQPAET